MSDDEGRQQGDEPRSDADATDVPPPHAAPAYPIFQISGGGTIKNLSYSGNTVIGAGPLVSIDDSGSIGRADITDNLHLTPDAVRALDANAPGLRDAVNAHRDAIFDNAGVLPSEVRADERAALKGILEEAAKPDGQRNQTRLRALAASIEDRAKAFQPLAATASLVVNIVAALTR